MTRDQHQELIDLPKAQRRTLSLKKQLFLASSKALPEASAPREPWYVNPSFGQKTAFVLVCAFLGFLFGIAMGEALSYDDAHHLVNPFDFDNGKLIVIAMLPVAMCILLGLILLPGFADAYRISAKKKKR